MLVRICWRQNRCQIGQLGARDAANLAVGIDDCGNEDNDAVIMIGAV